MRVPAIKRLFNQLQGDQLQGDELPPNFCKRRRKVFCVKDRYSPETNWCWYYRFTCLRIHYFSTRLTASLSAFKILSAKNVKSLIHNSTLKSCPLDPMPSPLVSRCDAPHTAITTIINKSLEARLSPMSWKEALVCLLHLKMVNISYPQISDQ